MGVTQQRWFQLACRSKSPGVTKEPCCNSGRRGHRALFPATALTEDTCSGMSGSSSKLGTLSVQGRNFFVSGSM